MPDPKYLILDSIDQKLMACNAVGAPGNDLAATEFPQPPNDCFCNSEPQLGNCVDTVFTCPLFASVPQIVVTGVLVVASPACPFTSTWTFTEPMTNIPASGGNPFNTSYSSLWAPSAPNPVDGPVGTWTLSTGGSCTGNDLFNFTVPMYGHVFQAADDGLDVTQYEAAVAGLGLQCINSGGLPLGSSWWFGLQTEIGTFDQMRMCPRWFHYTGLEHAICPSNSMIFAMGQDQSDACPGGTFIQIYDADNVSGLIFSG